MNRTIQNVMFFVSVFILFAWVFFTGDKNIEANIPVQVVSTEDILFTRCSCDSAVYCLSDDEYTVVMAQLSGRENFYKGE